jgi:hypothetical protein
LTLRRTKVAVTLLLFLVLGLDSGWVGALEYGARWTYRTSGAITSLDVTPDGSLVAVGTEQGVALVNSAGKCLWGIACKYPTRDVCIRSDGQLIFVAGSNSSWDGQLATFDHQGNQVKSSNIDGASGVDMSADAVYEGVIYAGSLIGATAGVWSTTSEEWVWHEMVGYSASHASISLSDTGGKAAAGGDTSIVLVTIDGRTLWESHDFASTDGEVSVAISGNGAYVVAGSSDEDAVRFYGSESSSSLWTYKTGHVNGVAMSVDGSYVVVGGDTQVYVFSQSGSLLWSAKVDGALAVAVSADGRVIYVGTSDKTVLCFRDMRGWAAQAIEEASSAVGRAGNKGASVSEAAALLAQAEQAFTQGSYTEAKGLAEQAKDSAFAASNQYTAASEAIAKAEAATGRASEFGVPSTEALTLLQQASDCLQSADYVQAKTLADKAAGIASALADRVSAAQKAIDQAEATIAKGKKKGVPTAEADTLLSKAVSAYNRGDYLQATTLAQSGRNMVSALLDAQGTATTTINEASEAIEAEKEAGFDVSRAEEYLAQAETAQTEKDYLTAITLGERAQSHALDIDQDGRPNRTDRFPTIHDGVIFGLAATGVVLLITAIGISARALRRRRANTIANLEAQSHAASQALDRLRRLQREVTPQ